MTKQEFIQRYKAENLTIGDEYMMVLDRITDEPLVLGCTYDHGNGKFSKQGSAEVTSLLKKSIMKVRRLIFFMKWYLVNIKYKRIKM